MTYVKCQARSKGTTHAILLKILASGRCKPQLSPSSRLLLLHPKAKGTLRGTHPAPQLPSVPVGSWREFVPLPCKAGSGWPRVTCHAIRARGMSAMWGSRRRALVRPAPVVQSARRHTRERVRAHTHSTEVGWAHTEEPQSSSEMERRGWVQVWLFKPRQSTQAL